ncbi:MAG: hypothetical protein LBG79_05650 [Spirochaetaceae bacterium]|jgi:hypothetical protein|nr:hypothetical protein [Spirochaetaceae bacterium]
MKKRSFFFLVFVVLIFGSCHLDEIEFPFDSGIDESFGNFYALKVEGEKNVWYRVDAPFVYEGTYCKIYVEKGQERRFLSLSEEFTQAKFLEKVKAIADEYDKKIQPAIVNAFGSIEDVDGDGKTLLLMLDIVDGYKLGSPAGYIGGFFQPDQMRSPKSFRYSNGADMLFIDTNPQTPGGIGFYSTIAHELQHLIHYSQTVAKGKQNKDTWINEGLSCGAEYIYSGDNNSRIDYYARQQNNSTSTLSTRQNTFYVWDGALIDYSTDYLFFQWLRVHSKADKEIYKSVLQSLKPNYESVMEAIADSANGFYKPLTQWQDVLKHWFASNYFYEEKKIDNIGYKDFGAFIKNKLKTSLYLPNNTTLTMPFESGYEMGVKFRNGEGVLCKNLSDTTLTGKPGVSYSILESNAVFNDSVPFKAGGILLVFNYETDPASTGLEVRIPIGKNTLTTGRSAVLNINPFDSLPEIPAMRDFQFSGE